MSTTTPNEMNYIIFKEGIPGFDKDKKFIIMPVEDEGPFYYLQSLDSDLCLLIADPFVFFPDYQIDLPDEQVNILGQGEAHEKLVVYVILTLHEDFRLTTANLMAPIIVNAITRNGVQYIPQQSGYSSKSVIFAAKNKPAQEGGL